ncbi:MAG: GLPGLI family protein [Bacteroides sp.]|nr:GLPGLI family protein [Bacteroides sp.]
MKQIVNIFLGFFILLSAANVMAKENETAYRAVYEFNEVYSYIGNDREPDLNDEKADVKFRKDIIRLELLPESSFCYSYHTWMTDSLKMEPNGEKIWYDMFRAWNRSDRSGEPTYPHMRSLWKIVKNRAENSMTVYDYCDNENYQYTDSISSFDWVITDSVSNKNGYDCILATCSYRGRQWEVWFSTDLPWHDGPWKFSGLPGLVVSASDTDGMYRFELTDIHPVSQPVKPWIKKPKKTTRKRFLEETFEYFKQLDGTAITAQFGITTDISPDKPRRPRIGMEKDYNWK